MGISAIWNYYTVLSRTRSTPNHSPVTLCIVLYSCAIHQNVMLVTIMVSSDYESKTFDMKQLPFLFSLFSSPLIYLFFDPPGQKKKKKRGCGRFHSTHAKTSFSFIFLTLGAQSHHTLPWCVGVLSCVSVTFISIETSFLVVLKTQENMKSGFFF